MKSIAVIFARFGPYHLARLENAGRFLAEKGVELVGIEVAGIDSMYAWDRVEEAQDFRRVTLFDSGDYFSISPRAIKEAIRQVLEDECPDAVALPGWIHPEAMAGVRWCNKSRKKAILMSDTARQDARRWWWREWLKRRIVSRFDVALVAGTVHKQYVCELGMAPERVFLGYDVIDNAYFSAGAEGARSQYGVLRAKYNLPMRYFLASSRFITKKNLPRLLQSFALYRRIDLSNAWDLVLCGDGPMKEQLLTEVDKLGVKQYVHFPGFVQYPELPVYYGLATVFIHPSTVEQWGLVVNEAMASRLPVLVSERCGCAPDLVEDGVNGYTFDPYDVEGMAEVMARVSIADVDLCEMGNASKRLISKWTPERFAEGLWQAIQSSLIS